MYPYFEVGLTINDLIDFSFVLEELEDKYCLDNGRNAIDRVRMFKYLLLKSIVDLSDVVDPSSLTKFRKLRLKGVALLDMLIVSGEPRTPPNTFF